ncbi:hypothetical protein J437_LFUL018781 [Ladona fulva]|uniref:Uncharacterized protein n=1 Tax=Ladona fulva TaxID=123851 RepID=A0A8K0KRE8_LADFU|nr:hypothetical protein J437_LFUL018781 [Ladona fulva]
MHKHICYRHFAGYGRFEYIQTDGGGLTDIFEANPADGWPVAHLIQDLVQLQEGLLEKQILHNSFSGSAITALPGRDILP